MNNKFRRISLKFFITSITLIVSIILVYYLIQKVSCRIAEPVIKQKMLEPIRGDVIVTVKNMITKDKKYYWMRVNIKWQINKFSRPIQFKEPKEIQDYVNSYLEGVTDSAIILSMLGKSSLDIFGSKRELEKEIKTKIEERLKSVVIDKKNITITAVVIVRYKYFDKPYEGKDFPPLANHENYTKQKPRLIKETAYPKDPQ